MGAQVCRCKDRVRGFSASRAVNVQLTLFNSPSTARLQVYYSRDLEKLDLSADASWECSGAASAVKCLKVFWRLC